MSEPRYDSGRSRRTGRKEIRIIRKAFTRLYQLLVFLSVIIGLYQSIKYLTDGSEYDLTVYLTEQNKIIENDSGLADLKIIYKKLEVKSLYSTTLLLKNSGKKAITRDFVFDPLIAKVQEPNAIFSLRSNAKSAKFRNNVITIEFDLLNPGEEISLLLLSSETPKIEFSYKIKEIKEISFIDYVNNPPAKTRLYSVNILWFILLLTSFLITLDALFLIKEDIKLGEIFGLIKDIRGNTNFNKEETLKELSTLYSAYVDALPFVFTSKERLISSMASKIDSLDTTKEVDRYILYQHAINLVRHGNLYSIRTTGIFLGPILLLICALGIGISIFS